MELFYTTSAGEDQIQELPQNSLGGFKSAVNVKNDDFDNLFGEISTLTINQDKDQYIALVLKNTTGTAITNVEVWFEVPETSYATFQIAAVDMVPNKDGVYQMERRRDIFDKPFNAEFFDCDVDNKSLIGDLAIDEMIGIWIKRKLNVTVIDTDQAAFYEKVPNNDYMYQNVELSQEDKIDFKLSWG